MTSGPDIEANFSTAETMIREAAAHGALLIVTPENTCHMRQPASEKLKTSADATHHPAISRFSALAKELQVWIMLGSVAVKLSEDKLANRSFLFSPQGELSAQYDKMHMFDVKLPTGEIHRESDIIHPGQRVAVADTELGKIGMTICYDVRFAYLYRKLAQLGAQIMTVPAAFTVPTGQAHWDVLLRARAIETGSYVIAAAQTGEHQGGRKTYGHSMIIGPWGEIIAAADDKVGIIYGEIDLANVDKARTAIPALLHDRQV